MDSPLARSDTDIAMEEHGRTLSPQTMVHSGTCVLAVHVHTLRLLSSFGTSANWLVVCSLDHRYYRLHTAFLL